MGEQTSAVILDLEWSVLEQVGDDVVGWYAAGPEREGWYVIRRDTVDDGYDLRRGKRFLATFSTLDDAQAAARDDVFKRFETFLARSRSGEGTVLGSLLDDLASLSSYVGSGLPDRIDPEDIADRIRHGIDFLTDALADDARRYRTLRQKGVMLDGHFLIGDDLDEAIDA